MPDPSSLNDHTAERFRTLSFIPALTAVQLEDARSRFRAALDGKRKPRRISDRPARTRAQTG